MSEPLLRVRDLVVEIRLARGVLRAVDGASFDVLPSEALGIVGESGSGKTMALRALLGLLPRAARITERARDSVRPAAKRAGASVRPQTEPAPEMAGAAEETNQSE